MAVYDGHTSDAGYDFDTYRELDGKLTEAAFSEFVHAATAKVDSAIWPNQVTDANRTKYHRCIGAVVDAMNDPAVVRESAGRISVEYAEARATSTIIREYLTGTGLLSRSI